MPLMNNRLNLDITLITTSTGDEAIYMGSTSVVALDPDDSQDAREMFDEVKESLFGMCQGITREIPFDFSKHPDLDEDQWNWSQVAGKVFGEQRKPVFWERLLRRAYL